MEYKFQRRSCKLFSPPERAGELSRRLKQNNAVHNVLYSAVVQVYKVVGSFCIVPIYNSLVQYKMKKNTVSRVIAEN